MSAYTKPKYILTQIHNENSKVTHEFSTDDLTETLEHMEWFLRGCSFVIDKYTTLKLVENELIEKLSQNIKCKADLKKEVKKQ